nr:hypothetical protein BdHM001_14130 [Bdellovibrio sp. HM001]
MKHKLLLLYAFWIRFFLLWVPDTPKLMAVRGFLYGLAMKKCGKDFQVASSAVLRGLENISCGDHVYIGPNASVMSRVSVVIEDEVLVAMNVVITDGNHGYSNGSYRYARAKNEPILIKKGAWLAANCVVTSGSIVGKGTMVGPCGVVRGTLVDDAVYLNPPLALAKQRI